jgi:hypothetical protein
MVPDDFQRIVAGDIHKTITVAVITAIELSTVALI